MNDDVCVCVCGKPVLDDEPRWPVSGKYPLHYECGRELWTDGALK